MHLYQVIRQVVPDRAVFYDDDTSSITGGLIQVVWEGRGKDEAYRQLNMARDVTAPKGTICVLHEYDFSTRQ